MKQFLLAVVITAHALLAQAVIETYQFDDDVKRERYQQFIQDLRCPKCQNQNLSGSNSPIAEDLRRELHRLLQEGKSDTEITQYMVARYGEFVLYRPPLNRDTVWLWFAPPVLLLIGAVVILMLLRRKNRTQVTAQLSAEQQQRLSQLLEEDDRLSARDKGDNK